MAHLLDYIFKPPNGENEEFNSFMEFGEDMNNLNIPFGVDSPELMSSDFFDCVMSMEQENFSNALDDGLDDGLVNNVISEGSETSLGHIEDVNLQSPSNTSNDSDIFLGSTTAIFKNESLMDMNDFITNNNQRSPITTKEQPKVNPPPSKVIISPANVKKVFLNKPVINSGGKKINKNKQQMVRVQSMSGNTRSLLVPVNMKNVKNIKIINASDISMNNMKIGTIGNAPKLPKKQEIHKYPTSSSESVDDDTDYEVGNSSRHPPLVLTPEEKRLLMKEGIQLPTHYPLTKNEEKELKRIRRKIRNKISAQDSRKRKKEYIDKLEEKAKRTSDENELLKKRIKFLKKQNSRLAEQMKKIQRLLFNTSTTKATPTTCLMIVLFSTLLVCLPNLRVFESKDLDKEQLFAARRALLFSQKSTEEENVNMEEFLIFNKEEDESELINVDEEPEMAGNEFSKFLSELAKKYDSLPNDKNCSEIDSSHGTLGEFCRKYEDDIKNVVNSMKEFLEMEGVPSTARKRQFIEPDISDDEESQVDSSDQAHSYKQVNSIKDEPPSNRYKINAQDVNFDDIPVIHTPTFSDGEQFTAVESKQYKATQE